MDYDITVTDEDSLLRKQIEALTIDRDAALARIAELERDGRLLVTVTEDNIRLKRRITEMQRRHRQELFDERKASRDRETVSSIIAAAMGFLASGAILLVYWLTRSGMI